MDQQHTESLNEKNAQILQFDKDMLTDRQEKVLNIICTSIAERGYPPTLREIGNLMEIKSTNGVNDHLRALERKGYLTREDMKSRTVLPTEKLKERYPKLAKVIAGGASEVTPSSNSDEVVFDDHNMIEIPILGRVAAGLPLEAIENHTDTVRIDRMLIGSAAGGATGKSRADVFGLKIVGESMIEAGIFDGDYVFVKKQLEVRRGAIVIVMVGGEATCKYFFRENTHVRLEPANRTMAPILIPKTDWRETQIIGVVVGVYRKMDR